MSVLHQISVTSRCESVRWNGLASILESLLPIRFDFSTNPQMPAETLACVIRIPQAIGVATLAQPLPTGASTADEPLRAITVRFANSPSVPFPFRGRTVESKVVAAPEILSLGDGEELLASCDQGPVWTVASAGGVKQFRSGFVPPGVPGAGTLREVFNGERFLELLPLIHWLREICAETEFEGPGPAACFVFDDPNLHWPTYGRVDYRELAARASKDNYHVAFATIPLDSWFTHDATADIFRRHPGQLSLCIHGNNHSKRELAQDYTQPQRAALLEQAIERISRLERKAAVPVSRVMVPPHGACSEAMLAQLPRSGFLGACISHSSVVAHNRSCPWTKTVGLLPSEMVDGCLITPRWGLAGNTTNTILLAAYLRQPMIFRGHHQDLRDGVEILGQLAGVINGLGPVNWSNLNILSKRTYQWRMEGTTCRVRPLCRQIEFTIPPTATHLILETPAGARWKNWQVAAAPNARLEACAGEPLKLPVLLTDVLAIEAAMGEPTIACLPGHAPAATRALARRFLTEGRDRLLA